MARQPASRGQRLARAEGGRARDAQLAQARALGARCKVDLAAQDWAAAFKSCEALEVFKGLSSGGIHDQDSRVYANYSSLAQLVNVDGATSEGRWQELATAWLDDSRTRAALSAGSPIIAHGRCTARSAVGPRL